MGWGGVGTMPGGAKNYISHIFTLYGNVIGENKAVHQSTSKIYEVMHQGRSEEGGGGVGGMGEGVRGAPPHKKKNK